MVEKTDEVTFSYNPLLYRKTLCSIKFCLPDTVRGSVKDVNKDIFSIYTVLDTPTV